MAELGVAPHDTAVISGIGCSSRLPYYMNTYAMQTVHGRAAAISTGCKVANPKITVRRFQGMVMGWLLVEIILYTPFVVIST